MGGGTVFFNIKFFLKIVECKNVYWVKKLRKCKEVKFVGNSILVIRN